MQLTLLKVGIGIDKFNELPSFVRYLDETTKFISQDAKKHIEQLEQKWKLEDSFTEVEDSVERLGKKLGCCS